MIKIFFAYRSKCSNVAHALKKDIEEKSPGCLILMLGNLGKGEGWKKVAKKKIKEADYFVFLNLLSDGNHFLLWELNYARQIGKKCFVYKLDNVELDTNLYEKSYSGSRVLKLGVNLISIDDLLAIAHGGNPILKKMLFNSKNDQCLLIEQYKVYLSTAESMIERRQKLSSTYTSIFSILIPAITFILSLKNRYATIGVIIVALILIFTCMFWLTAINSYAKSNAAKFEIIHQLELKLPANPFSSEWPVLNSTTKKYISFSAREKCVPILYIVLTSIISIVAVFSLFVP